jgi:hypothetical protein
MYLQTVRAEFVWLENKNVHMVGEENSFVLVIRGHT